MVLLNLTPYHVDTTQTQTKMVQTFEERTYVAKRAAKECNTGSNDNVLQMPPVESLRKKANRPVTKFERDFLF